MPTLLDAAYALTLLPHYVWHTRATGKYGPEAGEKLGCLPASLSPQRDCLWLHGVSVGETIASEPLAKGFAQRHPDWEQRFSTTTLTGRTVAQKRFGVDRVFYYPIDFSSAVRRAFDRINPKAVVLMELEIWPQFLHEAERRGVPVAVANVRITERSERRFLRFRKLAQPMLRRVALWLSQNDEYAHRLARIGVPENRIHVVGQLKYDSLPDGVDEQSRLEYRSLLGADARTFVLIAGSTHPGEDEAVLNAFADLPRDGMGPVKLVLAPRHPERIPDVERLAEARGRVVRRSRISPESPAANADIVLLDTVGELGRLYAAADAVVMGGTFSPAVGGHNMMEPCALERPTVIGPHVHNFAEPTALLLDADGIVSVQSPEDLLDAIQRLRENPAASAELARRAREAISQQRGATARSLDLLDGLLKV